MTAGLSKEIRYRKGRHTFSYGCKLPDDNKCANDTASLLITDGQFNLPKEFLRYVLVTIYTYHPGTSITNRD